MPTKQEFFDMKVKVLEDFDFQMVLSAMKTTKWTWYFPKKNRVPKLEELHKRANEILDLVKDTFPLYHSRCLPFHGM